MVLEISSDLELSMLKSDQNGIEIKHTLITKL